MNGMLREMRQALRSLGKRPLASISTIVTLALALAAGAVLLLVVHALYLAPLPWSHQDRLVYLTTEMNRIGVPDARMSWGMVHGVDGVPSLQGLAAYRGERVAMQRGEFAESVQATFAEPGLFAVLGADTVRHGRGFSIEEARADDAVVVVSDALAREWFGQAPAALGRDLPINGRSHRVIGVLAVGAGFPDRDHGLLLPMSRPVPSGQLDGNFGAIAAVGLRAADSAGIDGLATELDAVVMRMAEQSTEFKAARDITGLTLRALDWRQQRAGDVGGTIALLAAALAGLLLLAASNVSNVLMERVAARRNELSVRMALGASRRRVVGLVMADAVVLSLLGWLLGVLLAAALIAGQSHWLWLDNVAAAGVTMAVAPIGWSLLLTIALSVLTALLPALAAARLGGQGGLSQRGGSDGRAQRMRRVLVASQSALSLSLLVVALLLARSLLALWQIDPGFARQGVVTAEIDMTGPRWQDRAQRHRLALAVLDQMAATPGVAQVAVSDGLPFGSGYSLSAYELQGLTDPEQPPVAYRAGISSDWFQAMGMTLVRGRAFSDAESRSVGQGVAIIDQRLAERYFPDRDPLGQRLRFIGEDWLEIVGVVGSVRQSSLSEQEDNGQIYLPLAQAVPAQLQVVARTHLAVPALVAVLRDTLHGIDTGVPVRRVISMQQRLDDSLTSRSGPLAVVMFFALIAVLLAGIGLYGLLATAVVERRAEIGVRMALGADVARVVRSVVREGMVLVAAGLLAGVGLVALLLPVLRSHLFGIGAGDPVSYLLAAALMLAITLLACAIPAWRAGRVTPATALRND